ncbi:predicted protein [Sclerotinia sclerotiorum 1980 UF-70]|uniref:Uncharacterized protein n=2 Tax=Sclerotinia sclerotiorum (strain ATCC 18683 / 1980 / Ss-1) TaxID=665079 RepID=A7EUN6_SCLS1|nr:predicted protein [Sclerotinia sclerotiorum 1980 UF-70]APA15384.1 hypothetical protein sscle_14g101540 [Sclerotinia sclerotiorum 1980 UF-70]EDN93178.1 predicted protein [Sclerotinia sclerotiorum 1980 UF-70]
MSASRRMPKFEQAGKFTGENQSASRWLRRIKLDLAADNPDTISISMYLWAIDVLLEGPAAHWCDSVPKIKDILENYDKANMSEVKWLEGELIKQFPGNFVPPPVDRVIRSRSHSLEASSDSGSTATRLGKMYIGEKPKPWNQRREAPQVSEVQQRIRYHDDGQYKRGSRQNPAEGNVIDEYKFNDKPTTAPRSPKYHNQQYHSSTTSGQTPQVSKSYNTNRAQPPPSPKGILKRNTSYYRQPITRSHSSQDHPNVRYSRARSPPPIQSNRDTDQYRRPGTQQPQQLPDAHHPTGPSRPPVSRSMSQSSRTPYQGVTIVPSKSPKRSWSYVPSSSSRSTRYPVQKSPNNERDPLPNPRRSDSTSSSWKTSNTAIATLEHRRQSSALSPRKPEFERRTTYPKMGGEWR